MTASGAILAADDVAAVNGVVDGDGTIKGSLVCSHVIVIVNNLYILFCIR